MNHSQRLTSLEAEMLFTVNGYTAQLCCSEESKKTAYALRYRAYQNAGVIPENDSQLFFDDYDLLPNARTHLIWFEGRPVASVRSSIWSEKYKWTDVERIKYFQEDIEARIGLEKNLLESTRYVVYP